MNICGITGRLTDDVEIRTTTTNKSVVAFTLAVQRPKVKDKTDFIDCVAWGKTAEFISRYGCKGKKLEISGCITTRTYEHNGKKQKKTEILVDDVKFAESKKNEEGSSGGGEMPTYSQLNGDFEEISPDDDLPF